MIPRGVLDIGGFTLLQAVLRAGFSRFDPQVLTQQIERRWEGEPSPATRACVVCLSVRSGLDAVLSAYAWPAGSEIVVSAVTIPAMARIIEEHGLIPVPVDVDPQSLAPDLDQLQARVTPRTRAILVAHLFGSRLNLAELARIAQRNRIQLWEDVAQGYAADRFPGDALADVSFFSFGMIKARTALGGAVMRFRDLQLAAQVRAVQSQWPTQSRGAFRAKQRRAMLLQLLSRRTLLTAATVAASIMGIDLDEWLSRSVQAFDPQSLLKQLRQQPSGPLLELLLRRLRDPDRRWLEQKSALANNYRERLPPSVLLGSTANFPAHWVMPVVSQNARSLVSRLRSLGYDATQRASHLAVVPAPVTHPEWDAPQAGRWVSQIVFLPLHPALRPRHLEAIAATVTEQG